MSRQTVLRIHGEEIKKSRSIIYLSLSSFYYNWCQKFQMRQQGQQHHPDILQGQQLEPFTVWKIKERRCLTTCIINLARMASLYQIMFNKGKNSPSTDKLKLKFMKGKQLINCHLILCIYMTGVASL